MLYKPRIIIMCVCVKIFVMARFGHRPPCTLRFLNQAQIKTWVFLQAPDKNPSRMFKKLRGGKNGNMKTSIGYLHGSLTIIGNTCERKSSFNALGRYFGNV